MRKLTSLSVLFVSILFWASSALSQAADAIVVPIDVESVVLDKRSTSTVCPNFHRAPGGACSKETARVKVTTTLKNGQNDAVYYYSPSQGTIDGTGPSVVWDLSTVRPGMYSISVGAGNGGVITGRIVTRTIKVEECDPCDPPCSCPFFQISGPSQQVKAGQAFVVRAETSGGVTYDWTTSGGTIVDGQKGSQVMIRTSPSDADKVITVTIEIGGTDPACNCDRIKTQTVSIVK